MIRTNMALLLFWLFVAVVCPAQQPSMNVQELITLGLQQNQAIKSKSLDILSSQSLMKTAGELPKLDVQTQLGQYNTIKTDHAFLLTQSIPFPTIHRAKKSLIQADVKNKEWSKSVTENEIRYKIRQLYYQWLYVHQHDLQLQYLDSLYTEYIRIAKLRFKVGDVKNIEISSAEVKKNELGLLLSQNQSEKEIILAQLKYVVNTSESIQLTIADAYIPLILTHAFDTSGLAGHPALHAIQQESILVDQKKLVEKALSQPDFLFGYTNQSLIGFQQIDNQEKYFGGGKRFNVVNLGVSIPITPGVTKARVQSLEFQKQSVLSTAADIQHQLTMQLNNAYTQYRQEMTSYEYFHGQAIPHARTMVDETRKGYQNGDITYLEYLYALQWMTDVQLKRLESIDHINQTVVQVWYLMGK